MLSCQRVKGAVGQHEDVIFRTRFVAIVGEHAVDRPAECYRAATPTQPSVDEIAHTVAFGDRGLVQRVSDRPIGLARDRDGLCHDPSRQVVPAFGHADRQFTRRAPITLGRTSCTRPAPTGRPAVLAVQQPVGFQLVQVELRYVRRHIDRRGGLFTPDRLRFASDVAIERPADRFAQCREPTYLLVEALVLV